MLDIYHQGEYTKVAGAEMREVDEISGSTDLHIEKILGAMGPLPQSKKRLRVVLDACNGAGSLMTPKLLGSLGCEVVSINTIPNGIFPHPPEPVPQNLMDLCRLVKESGADVGFAQDADADRLAIVSEEGTAIGEITLVLATLYVLESRVVVDACHHIVATKIATRFGCPLFLTKIGEVNVTEGYETGCYITAVKATAASSRASICTR
jgi:phosphomannomutase